MAWTFFLIMILGTAMTNAEVDPRKASESAGKKTEKLNSDAIDRTPPTSRLHVSENNRFLVREDGRPFFWLGDTAWELFHRCDREEVDHYLQTRADQGYTVIQAVVLAELDGLNDPNPYGHTPLIDNDPTQPNEPYFEHVDYVIHKANELGLFVAVLPTWGDKWHSWGRGPVVFTPENAGVFGEYLGNRYGDHTNIIWVVGGDRRIDNETQRAINIALAEGLRKGDEGAHLISFHPHGGEGSAQYFHDEDWLDFNMRQTGHTVLFPSRYERVREDYRRLPTKPVLDGEPLYEDHPIDFRPQEQGHSTAIDVRRPLYWNLFGGAFGHTYGHHSVWQMWQPGRSPVNHPLMPWREALEAPGAQQMQHGRWLIESRPMLTRIPDDSILVVHRSDEARHEDQRNNIVTTELTHIAYTRDQAGRATLFVNGEVVASRNDGGDLSNWDEGFRLALGNELTGDRPWLGELHRVAIYNRVIDADQVARAAETGLDDAPAEALVFYDFQEGEGQVLRDTSGTGEPLDLRVEDPAAVQWLSGGGLRIAGPARIESPGSATKVIEAVKESGAITIEAWIRPENTVQAGPARIVTVSRDTSARNFTLGQAGPGYDVRFRTTAHSHNGEPALSSPGTDTPNVPVVPTAVPGSGRYRYTATRDQNGTYAMIYAPIGRPFTVRMDVIQGEQVVAWWYNPRDGQAKRIGMFDAQGRRTFTPPDPVDLDWILVLDDAAAGYPKPGTRR